MDTWIRDVRYGFRMLFRTPSTSALAVLALALGIGANSAIFSVVYAVLLRPLPVHDAGSLVAIGSYNPKFNIPPINPGYTVLNSWKREARSFESVAASWAGTAELGVGIEQEKVPYWRVSANFFPALGVQPILGRGFTDDEDRPGAARVVVIGHDLWKRRFFGQTGAVGASLKVGDNVCTIVGVAPPGFHVDGKPADVYAPIGVDFLNPRSYLPVTAYARLKPGVTVAQANSEMEAVSARLDTRGGGWRARVVTLRDSMVRDVRLSLLVLLGAVAMVLLIACANIASLLLARSAARQREAAIRAALGAPRSRLLRQFLTESVLLSLVGGAAGLLLARWCVHLVPLIQNVRLPNLLLATRVDSTVLLFTAAISVLTGVAFGAAPALAGASTAVYEELKEGGRAGETRGRKRLWSTLVVIETALAVMLMIGATLLMRTFLYLRDTAPGFRVDGLLTATIAAPAQKLAFYNQVLEQVRAIPGVESATLASSLPLDGDYRAMSLPAEGQQYARPQDWPILWHRTVDPQYFHTLQIPLRRGRLFDERDREGAPRVAVVNESMARRLFSGQDPLGKHLGNTKTDYFEIVGVVADVRHQDATKDGLVEVFFPLAQAPPPSMALAVRADGRIARDAMLLAPSVERAVKTVNPAVSLAHVQEMQQMASDRLAPKRLTGTIVVVFAGLALVLAAIGIYGVLSFTVAQRTHEIGVRMAVGADRSSVVRMVAGKAAALAGTGILIGAVASLAAGRVISSLLYGVSSTEPAVFAGVSATLLAVALVAAYLPARRAACVDPVTALRHE